MGDQEDLDALQIIDRRVPDAHFRSDDVAYVLVRQIDGLLQGGVRYVVLELSKDRKNN